MTTDSYVTITPKILYFGTPVALLTTCNPDGSANLAPMSSCWALGCTLLLGLGAGGQTAANLGRHPELVVNVPGPDLWQHVERLAPLTGADPVPAHKAAYSRYEPDKFSAAGLTPLPATRVRPPRVDRCPLQLEATVTALHPIGPDDDLLAVEAEVVHVHAHRGVVIDGTDHIDTSRWRPLIYSFRHYFTLDTDLGHSFRAEA